MTHILIISARFYTGISDLLEQGAQAALTQAGATCEIIHVPGALEIPAAIRFAINAKLPLPPGEGWGEGASMQGMPTRIAPHPNPLPEGEGIRRYDGYIALGCVIRGETWHFEIVCNDSARGLTWLAIEHNAAIGNGILTVENEAQAILRADPAQGDKGGDAARACLQLLALKQRFGVTA